MKRRRSRPEIVVYPGRNRLLWCATDGVPLVEAEAASKVYVANQTLPHLLDALDYGARGAVVGSVLSDPVVLLRGQNQLLAFPQVMAARLLDVNVLPGLESPDSDQGMPVIGRRNGERVNGGVFQKFAHLSVSLRGRQAHPVHVREAPLHDVFIHIAHGHDLHVRHARVFLDVLKAHSPQPADSNTDAVVGAKDPLRFGNKADSRQSRTGPFFDRCLTDAH